MTTTFDVDAALSAANQLRAAAQGLIDKRAELQTVVNSAQESIAVLYRLPLRPDEIKAAMLEQIDQQAKDFVTRGGWRDLVDSVVHPKRLRPTCGGPLNLQQSTYHQHDFDLNLQDLVQGFPLVDMGLLKLQDGAGKFNSAAICFLFGDLIKAKLDDDLSKWLPERVKSPVKIKPAGIPGIAERRLLIDELQDQADRAQAEIDDIDAKLESLQGAATMPKVQKA
jgi:hypothetical protein